MLQENNGKYFDQHYYYQKIKYLEMRTILFIYFYFKRQNLGYVLDFVIRTYDPSRMVINHFKTNQR